MANCKVTTLFSTELCQADCLIFLKASFQERQPSVFKLDFIHLMTLEHNEMTERRNPNPIFRNYTALALQPRDCFFL